MSKKILLIEDDKILRENTMILLQEEGFEAFSAADGDIGIVMALEVIPDLVLCDISMPGMNGYEVYKCLQKQESTSDIPFIFITAKAQKEDLRYAMRLGADDYITKPYSYDDLLDSINIRMAKHENRTKQQDSKIRSVIENPLLGIFIIENHKIKFANKKLTEIFGYTNNNEICNISIKKVVFKDDLDMISNQLNQCINGDLPSIDLSFRAVSATGEILNVSGFITSSNQSNKGYAVGYLNINHPLNEPAKNKIKSEFLCLIGNEIQIPLQALKWPLELLKHKADNKNMIDLIEIIDKSAYRLECVFSKLIDIASIQAEMYPINPTVNSLAILVEFAENAMQSELSNKKITTEILIQDNLFLSGDKEMIIKCITNILDNAIKFSKTESKIILEGTKSKHGTELKIIDSGAGIKPEILKIMNSSEIKYGKGIGAGLLHTRVLMEANNGSIEIKSDEISGTTVTLLFASID